MSSSQAPTEFDSQVLKACIKAEQYDKDVDDLIEEVNNLSNTFKDFKEELLEDLCNVIGLNIDKFVMDKFEEKNKGKENKEEKEEDNSSKVSK